MDPELVDTYKNLPPLKYVLHLIQSHILRCLNRKVKCTVSAQPEVELEVIPFSSTKQAVESVDLACVAFLL